MSLRRSIVSRTFQAFEARIPATQFSRSFSGAKDKYDSENSILLERATNQARGIAEFSIDFMNGKIGNPDQAVIDKVVAYHTDSVVCGISALALKTNAPTVLRDEALSYPSANGATVFGSDARVFPEKAILANASAVREWDSNGTVFGYNKKMGHTAGEFGHNDYYPVAVAACQLKGGDGKEAVRGMLLSDEIRGRLAEVFSLKDYKIDHVVHGAIASAATYGAIMGATVDQIESAIGMVVAHYIPFRAIRAGHQLSDSKGASAAISTEAAILCVNRSMKGFLGPRDIFRNPQAIFRLFEGPKDGDASPFDIVLSHTGSDFAVMGMHFKLGLYEHQSAGALQGVIDLVRKSPEILSKTITNINIVAYEPAYGIIGDPAKWDPTTRQSADHSMVFIVSRLLSKARKMLANKSVTNDDAWKTLMLEPVDYSESALYDAETRELMSQITFAHGGAEYDAKYPDGIPTSVVITTSDGQTYDSGFVMYPSGHARNTTCDLNGILSHKNKLLAGLALPESEVASYLERLNNIEHATAADLASMYSSPITISTSNEVY